MEIPVRSDIFLQGVFFSRVQTLEDRMLEENISHQENNLIEPRRDINDIRITRFRNKKQWVEAYKESTLKCWYCGLSFKGIPCFIPRQIRNTATGKEYDTYGLFCGFACAFSFLQTQSIFIKNKTYFDKLSMLKMLFVIFYNKKIAEFKSAPCIYNLTSYGGHIDIVEYRNNLRNINANMISSATVIKQD